MDSKEKKKRKGGAEKIRDKKQKTLEASAHKCMKITSLFSCSQEPSHIPSIPGPSASSSKVNLIASQEFTSPEEHEGNQNTESGNANCNVEKLEQLTDSYIHIRPTTINEVKILDLSTDIDKSTICTTTVNAPSICRQNVKLEYEYNYFVRPKKNQITSFFNYHPNQDIKDDVLRKVVNRKDGTNRVWLTYCNEQNALFCSVCLAYSNSSESNSFMEGMTDRRHIHQRVEEHERCMMHRACVEAYFLKTKNSDIDNLLLCNQMSVRREQVRKRRQVLERLIDIFKVIGKRGLSYRGSKYEAAYTLEDIYIDHGILELVLLLRKYDLHLNEHVNDCIEQSRRLNASGKTGRGSLVTLLSKTTANKIIETIRLLIQNTVASEVRAAGMFSVQIDTTQDITSTDQCSVIVRYVTDSVHEKLLTVINCESSTGESMYQLLVRVLESCKIDIKNCIGSSTDGASNMRGQYNGFSAWLSKESPDVIHVWCYAHILNLVLSDTATTAIAGATLFKLLNDIAVFIRDSYKRMNIWQNVREGTDHRKLSTIGDTRWWSKDAATRKVFGNFSNPESALYIDAIITLTKIQENSNLNSDVRAKAAGFIEGLLKYETIVTAQIFLRIFELTSPLSKYLQTSGMDILKAHQMVSSTHEELRKCARDFDAIENAADKFVVWVREKLEKLEGCELEVQVALPQKRPRRVKVMPGEKTQDEVFNDARTSYKIKTHNVILDVIIESMGRRFQASRTLYADFACLDPRNFSEIEKRELHTPVLEELSKRLIKFDERATAKNLRCELMSLALHWNKLKTSTLEAYTLRVDRETPLLDANYEIREWDLDMECDKEDEMEFVSKTCSACKNCASCCYQILRRYNLLTDAYHVIGLAYKYLLTLSITQVACERSFSTLKFIKNRLRSTATQEHLDSFMLMAVEKEILMNLDSNEVIDRIAETSELLRNLLTL